MLTEEDEDDDDGSDEVIDEVEPPEVQAPIVEEVMDGDELDENEEGEDTSDNAILPPPLDNQRQTK